MGKIRLEVVPLLAETLGMERTSEEVLPDEENEGDYSVRGLLNRLCSRYRRIDQIVFDVHTQQLTGQVVIFLNDLPLALADGLETRLEDGDRLTLIPFIEGG